MKKISWIVVVGLLLLVAVLLINTLLLKSKQLLAPAKQPVVFDSQDIANKLAVGIQLPTISYTELERWDYEPFKAFNELLVRQYPTAHKVLQRQLVNEYSVLYKWAGTQQATPMRSVLLMAHTDIVPVAADVSDQWLYPPFDGVQAKGQVWGRGALDDKGSIYMLFSALERLAEQGFEPKHDIYIALGHDEEVGGQEGAQHIIQYLQAQNIELDFVLDEGGSVASGVMAGLSRPAAVVGVAEKAYVSLKLSVATAGGHASMPPKHTAITRLSRALTLLNDQPMPSRLTPPVRQMLEYMAPELPFAQRLAMANMWLFEPLIMRQLAAKPKTYALLHSTAAQTMFTAGFKDNVLPKAAHAVINFRLLPGDTEAGLKEYVADVIADPDILIERYDRFGPPRTVVSDIETDVFVALQNSINQVWPDAVVVPYLVMATTDSRHYTQISKQVFRFAPLVVTAEDLASIHTTNERINIASLAQGADFYFQLLHNLTATAVKEPK